MFVALTFARVTRPQDAHLNSIVQVLLKLCSQSSSVFPPRLNLLMERFFSFVNPQQFAVRLLL